MEAVIGFAGLLTTVIVIAVLIGARRKSAQSTKQPSRTAQRSAHDEGVLLI